MQLLTVYPTTMQSPWTVVSQHLVDAWHIVSTQYTFKWVNACMNELKSSSGDSGRGEEIM